MFRKSYHLLGFGRLQLFTKKMTNLHVQTDDELSRPDGCSHVMAGCASGSRRRRVAAANKRKLIKDQLPGITRGATRRVGVA